MIATNIALPQRFDASMQPIDRLHPSKAGYDLNESPLSSASMTLSAETVEQGEFVRMFDTYGAVDVFRIAKVKAKYAKGQREQDVTLEHALATLGDVLIRGYYEFGGTGITTAQVLTTLLALQPVTYWVLGACEYADEYQYSVENESLLNTLLSVASPLTAPYRWTFDTTTFPFMLNLVQASNIPTLEFRMSRNVQSVSHTVDRRDLRTRLYPLGYGEGVNQLTIADVNGGVEYIEANTGTYGVISDTFVDTSVTDAQMLKNTAQAYLDVASEPSVLTEVDGIDVFLRTGEPMDAPRLGAVASVPIAELGIDLAERVIRVVKNDIYGAPHKVKVTLTNQKRDSVRETAALMRKSRIGDLYSQGSISFVPLHFADNADAGNKLACDFYIDAQEININQVLCKFKLEAFRSYSNVSAAGGGQTRTSSSGGGGSVTSESGGGQYISNSGSTGGAKNEYGTKSYTGGIAVPTDTGAASGNTGSASLSTDDASPNTNWAGGGSTGSASADVVGVSSNTYGPDSHAHLSGTYYAASHSHSGSSHYHDVNSHYHGIPSHSHSIGSHTHDITTHTHGDFDHFHFVTVGFTIENHNHNVSIGSHSHSVTIDDHTHAIVHGIYRGTTASSVMVAVDGNAVDPGDITSNQFDAVPYLAKDSNGKITRNTWHTIAFTPNTLTRIVADIQKKTFVRAVSGGNY